MKVVNRKANFLLNESIRISNRFESRIGMLYWPVRMTPCHNFPLCCKLKQPSCTFHDATYCIVSVNFMYLHSNHMYLCSVL